ncbi:MAG TPA: anhydro-N-acetylmuramic acid kinase AnmK [Haloplasmataceae bacterium]
MIGIGLMSGTSLDGIDAALVEIQEDNGRIRYQLIHFLTKPFRPGIREEIERAISLERSTAQLICSLNFKLGYEFAASAQCVAKEAGVPMERVDFIASHGQTIWHQPIEEGEYVPSTLQIGEPAVIAYETGRPVISNFRVMDMAAGGQGAPLVSYTDYLLYRSDDEHLVLQNIGGIANLTYLPKGCTIDDVRSFDTGPGNMMIDEAVKRYFNLPYDPDGSIARRGCVITPLLNRLMDDPFIQMAPPKTTGRERYGKQYVERIIASLDEAVRAEDVVATFTEFVIQSIVHHYRQLGPIDRVIVSGGGSRNQYILNGLKRELSCDVVPLEAIDENSDAKEAIAFALLGYETLHGRTNNVKQATGARRAVILGHITPKPY